MAGLGDHAQAAFEEEDPLAEAEQAEALSRVGVRLDDGAVEADALVLHLDFNHLLLQDPAPEEGLIHPGVFRSERLVSMAKHDYSLEPNAMFTPDMKWIVFRSNMFGPSHVFAVEVAKTQK